MPRKPMDYSKTLIYKIQHTTDESLLYVGHTTDFTKRKSAHKQHTNRENGNEYKRKVYTMIRENGGWEMFNMIEVKKFPCNNKREAEAEEDKVMREMKASMNTNRAFLTPDDIKQYYKDWRTIHSEEIKTKSQINRDKLNYDENGEFSIDCFIKKLRKQKEYREAYKQRQREKKNVEQ